MEIACDHGTVRRLGETERMTYGMMILDFSKASGKRRIYSYGTMLRSGGAEIKERILRLTERGKSRASEGVLVILFMTVVTGCVFTGTSQRSVGDRTENVAAANVSTSEKDEVLSGEDDASGNTDLSETSGEDTDNGEESVAEGSFDPDENISEERQLAMVWFTRKETRTNMVFMWFCFIPMEI